MSEKEKNTIEVPVRGSLGLLALGDKGLVLWRKKKAEHRKEMIKNQKEGKKDV